VPKIDYQPDVPLGLTVDQVAAELQIAVSSAYKLIEAKVIPAMRPTPGAVRVPRPLLQQWMIDRAMEETYGDADPAEDLGPRRRGPAGARRRGGRSA
jgi:excisionase family DNA binding protein